MSTRRGFTFIETIVVVGILMLLLALISPNFLNLSSRTSAATTVDILVTDIKNQQIKAMTGDTEGRGLPDDYGMYIQPASYVLFHGQNFPVNDPDNFVIPIDENYDLATTFPEGKIVFNKGSGEIASFNQANNSVTLTESRTGVSKIIRLNKYGTIIQNN